LPSRPLLLRCLPDQYGTTFALFEKIKSEERKLKDGFQSEAALLGSGRPTHV
jgi:hypothetical protein